MLMVITARHKQIGKQLLKEFWFPFVFAGAWAFFTWPTGEPISLSKVIARFATTFFFVSWLLAQMFRVSKQVKTETSLHDIKSQMGDVVTGVQRSQETAAWVTGGTSYAIAVPAQASGRSSAPHLLTIATKGIYPLFEVKARVIDVDAISAVGGVSDQASAATNSTHSLGDLTGDTSYANRIQLALDAIPDTGDRRFNIVFTARNGTWTQSLRYKFYGGAWHAAHRVVRPDGTRREEELERHVPPGYPNSDTINWD